MLATDDLLQLADTARAHSISLLQLVPSVVQAILSAGGPLLIPSLRVMVLTGEALPRPLLDTLLLAHPHVMLLNHYGCTEAADTTSSWQCTAPMGPAPIGKPVRYRMVHLLDSEQRPVPIGTVGKVWVLGVGVAEGYLHQPALTAAKFSNREHYKAFATGDRASWSRGGLLLFAGREDEQVQLALALALTLRMSRCS